MSDELIVQQMKEKWLKEGQEAEDTQNIENPEPVAQEEVLSPASEVPSEQSKEETRQAKNFRSLRDQAERAERERDEAIRLLREIEARNQQKSSPIQEDYDINLGPDDLAEGKHLNKVAQKIKKLEEQVNYYQRQSAEMAIETRLKAQYPDFEKIVSSQNVEQLRMNYPEIAQTINSSPDLYNKAVAAYMMIKKLGIQPEESYNYEKVLAQKNIAKPRPAGSVAPQAADSPLSKANAFGLTEELKKHYLKEMVEAKKNY